MYFPIVNVNVQIKYVCCAMGKGRRGYVNLSAKSFDPSQHGQSMQSDSNQLLLEKMFT